MKLINVTGRNLDIYDKDGKEIVTTILSEGAATVQVSRTECGKVGDFALHRTEYGEIEGLPEPEDGIVYIVNFFVLNALRYHGIQRNDCVSPDTAFQSAVRDEQGHVIGIRGFQMI